MMRHLGNMMGWVCAEGGRTSCEQRSVRVEGSVEKVTQEESEAYYWSRPRGSQVCACAPCVCWGGGVGFIWSRGGPSILPMALLGELGWSRR